MQVAPDYIVIKRMYAETMANNIYDKLLTLTNYYGTMAEWLIQARKGGKDYIIYVAFDKRQNQPVGWIMSTNIPDSHLYNGENKIGTYVNEYYRRQGIGAKLVEAMKKVNQEFLFWRGNNQADSFYGATIQKSTEFNYSWSKVNG